MRTVVDELRDLGKKMGFAAWQVNGDESARWILLDCVNVVVHLFDAESRDFYDLELLWGDAPRVDWRKELGLPPAPAETAERKDRFAQAAGSDEMEAEEEDARLEGRDDDDEEGDADVDEDAEDDAPIVTEFPDESTGSNSVEFVEIDPPGKRRKRGRTVYPTPLEEQEDTTAEERSMGPIKDLGGASESLDEDDRQRAADAEADRDPEATSREDLPAKKIRSRPMGGVSASLSSTDIIEPEEGDQLGDLDASDREQDHKDEIPEAHETAAETIRVGNVELSTEEPSSKPRKKALKTRADERAPRRAAPTPVNPKKAKAGVVIKKPAKKPAAKKAAAKKPPAKKSAAKKPVKAKAKAAKKKK